MRKAYVPVPPARPVVSVSRKSHLAGFERAARILRERASSRVRESNSRATGEGSENSGVENQFRTAKCSPERFFETPAPRRRPRATYSSGDRNELGRAGIARAGLSAARRENLSAVAAIYAPKRSRMARAASFARGARSPAGPTQEGQPRSHSHAEMSSRVFCTRRSWARKSGSEKPMPPG